MKREKPGGMVRAARPGDAQPIAAGRGAGRRLLAAATRLLADAGFTDASLWVLSGNRPARGFYESQGWRCEGIEHQWTPSGDTGVPEVRYVRRLDGRSGAR